MLAQNLLKNDHKTQGMSISFSFCNEFWKRTFDLDFSVWRRLREDSVALYNQTALCCCPSNVGVVPQPLVLE